MIMDVQDAELAVMLLYQLGEGAAEETLKQGRGALGQLAPGLLPLSLPQIGSISLQLISHAATSNPNPASQSLLTLMKVNANLY